MKKFLSPLFALIAISVVLIAGALFAGKPAAAPVAPAETNQVAAFTSSDALPLAAAADVAPLLAIKPDVAFAVLLLAICSLAVLALARGARGAAKLSLPQLIRFAGAITLNALDRMIVAVFPSFHYGRRLGVDSWTKIADLWVPEVLTEMMQEPVVERASFLDSGVVVTSPLLTEIASGPGTEVSLPFIVEPNHADQQQTEDTAPDIKALASAKQKAAFFNRVSTLGATALSGIISGVKPGGDILTVLVGAIRGLRSRQRNRLALAQLSGLFGVASAPNAGTGAFRALRYDAFSETGASPADTLLIDSTKMLYAAALLGENKEQLTGGAIVMHSVIEAALADQDQIDVIRNSQGEIVLRQWKGLQVFISDLLVRNGGVSGKVYYTFLCGRGSIASGDKPQIVTNLAGEVAALQLALTDIAKNNVAVYDRTRFLLHPQGAKWNVDNDALDVPEAGPSNAEVADPASWTLGAADIKNTRIVCMRTNG